MSHKDNDVWILHIDDDFVNASCGGIFQNFIWWDTINNKKKNYQVKLN